jgi:predicted O-methyltransferase YrrM
LKTEFGKESFDLVFIDADKENIKNYYEEALYLLRATGVILVDNVLWSGHVVDKSHQEESTRAIRAFNDFVCADPRVDANLLTIGDGLMWIIKK